MRFPAGGRAVLRKMGKPPLYNSAVFQARPPCGLPASYVAVPGFRSRTQVDTAMIINHIPKNGANSARPISCAR